MKSAYEKFINKKLRVTLSKVKKDFTMLSDGGKELHYESYVNKEAKGVIVISHGFCEFTLKFEEVIFRFYEKGYNVYIIDHRGHGYSHRSVKDPGKVYIKSYKTYISDFHKFTRIIKKENEGLPLYLFGHSMGGTIAALYLEKYTHDYKAGILSSPMIKMKYDKYPSWLNYAYVALGMFLGKKFEYVPGHKGFDGKPNFKESSCISRDRYNLNFQKRLENVRYQTFGATYGWAFASMNAVEKLMVGAKKIDIPILLCQAGIETVVDNKGQDKIVKKLSKVKFIRYQESKHEIYSANEETLEKYYYDIFKFLERV